MNSIVLEDSHEKEPRLGLKEKAPVTGICEGVITSIAKEPKVIGVRI